MTARLIPITKPMVLVADDDPTVRILCEQSLQASGFDVATFADGAAALLGLHRLQPDIVLLDVQMPGSDGFSVCQKIRDQDSMKDIPVVMITGNDDTKSIDYAYEIGATDFIRKPIAWAVLPHRIRYLLRAKEAFANLKRAEQRTRAILQTVPDTILCIGSDGTIREIVGGELWNPHEATSPKGQPLESFFHPQAAKKVREHMHTALAAGGVHLIEHDLGDGRRHCETRIIAQDEHCVLAIVRDITDRKESAAKIHQLAYFDSLTGLPNRQQLVHALRREIAHAKRQDSSIAILFIDLDRFKRINDTFGHSVGDELLKAVANRLENCIRATDYVARLESEHLSNVQLARLGGDEFILLITNIEAEKEASDVATRIGDALAAPFSFESQQFVVTPSVGIAMYPEDGENVDELLMNSDAAMYRAKSDGRNRFQFYSHSMRTRALEQLELETDLRQAIDEQAMSLHYQPKVEISTWSVVGVEALLRWRHPIRGWISPGEFIPLAEETGLIVKLGEWVVREACSQLKQWQQNGLDNISIAVNVSSQQFCHGDLLNTVLQHVWEAAVSPHRLELEITESLLMNDLHETVASLQSFRDAGIRLSVDDFGTGYSSLAYLKQFPLNSLKIDQSFVHEMHMNKDDAAICAAILAMAKELGLKVVAEGVELEEQLELLRQQGCDEIQGFLFSKPLPADDVEALIRDSKVKNQHFSLRS